MNRLKILQIIIIAVALSIIARLFYWQFLANIPSQSSSYSQEIKLPASRGQIFASDNFPLATNQEEFLIYAKPKEIDKESDLAKKIAPFLISEKYATAGANLLEEQKKQKETEIGKKEEEITQKIKNKNLLWVQIGRKVPKNIKNKLDELKIKGLGFERDEKRFYPEASMAAHLLGFVGSDKFGDDTGYFGLEGFFDEKLKGKSGKLGLDKDPFGFPILVSKYRTVEPKEGESLILTIDRTIQYIVEQKLKAATEKYGAKQGTVIVSQPQTGQILAMATYPSYDPNLFTEFNEKDYKNPAVADTYEPGSTFKLITIAAALDTAVVSPQTKCEVCSGPRQIGGYEISTWNKKYYPNSTITEVIQHSDNVGMTFVAEKLGTDKLFDYIQKFGFDKNTGIELQEETTGVIRDKEQWRQIDLATASFGQGLAVTPIQMVQTVQTIANGGKQIPPRLVKAVIEKDKQKPVKQPAEKQLISQKTAAQITEMMVNAVENGEARAFKPKGYRIAGKTGTAQIPLAGHYDPEKTIASFVGFAPAQNPRFVMLVRFTEPSSSIFGSETAAPTFFEIAKEIFSYLAISPKDN